MSEVLKIYHERQLGGLCGVHCLNNLLQGPRFGPGDLAEIGVDLDREEQALMAVVEGGAEGEAAAEPQPYNVDPSADGGNFSIQVLVRALKSFHLELLPAMHPDARARMEDPASAAEAFLCQYRDHWFAVRKVAGHWWNLNSTKTKPAPVSEFYLSAWLGQLREEGYSIFLVVGDVWPAPAEPQSDEMFHDIEELLANRGNPLGNDDADQPPVIPPDAGAAQARYVPAGGFSDTGGADHAWWSGAGNGADPLQLALQRCYGGTGGSAASPQLGRADSRVLKDMGFHELQIRVARELGRPRGQAASDVLMAFKGIDSSLETDGAKLADAIQKAVASCDRSSGPQLEENILTLVALLCVDKAMLQTAATHASPATLLESLLAVLARWNSGWPEAFVRAASIVAEVLAMMPPVPETSGGAQKFHSAKRPPAMVVQPVGDVPLEASACF